MYVIVIRNSPPYVRTPFLNDDVNVDTTVNACVSFDCCSLFAIAFLEYNALGTTKEYDQRLEYQNATRITHTRPKGGT